MEPFFVCGIKIDAAFWTEISALASKLMPLRAPSLIPSGRSHLSRCFWKKPPKILLLRRNPVIALHFLHGWKPFCAPPQKDSFTYPMVGGRFVNLSGGKFSYNPLQQLLRLKNDTIFEKIFPQSYTATFKAEKRHIFRNFFKKASCSYTASFFGRI